MPMKSGDIIKQRNTFWTSKNHAWLQPVSLVAAKDSTALFNVAGMQQLIPFLSGKAHPLGKRLYNIQWCLRTNDIDEIGDERHLSYFTMMWNWSLGDYFKHDAITWSVEFLHNYLWMPKERIWATIFAGSDKHNIPRDTISENLLQELGITHITAIWFDENDDSDNFWIAGSEGPCGPCCEFYIDRGVDGEVYADPLNGNLMQSDRLLGTNDRYTEVRNNVFMEFYKNKDWSLTQLPQQNVDTWMGLERMCMIIQDKETIFETDIFENIIKNIEEFLWIEYPPYYRDAAHQTDKDKIVMRGFRIITDHVRASLTLMRDGVLPSNEGRGYVLRRLIRRMYYHLQKNGLDMKAWNQTHEDLAKLFGSIAQSLFRKDHTDIVAGITKECVQFQDTIKRWEKILMQAYEKAAKTDKILSGQFAFQAYDTYGIPVELLLEMAQQQGINVDMDWYNVAMEDARALSRSATKKKFSKWTDWSAYISDIKQTDYMWYASTLSQDMVLLKDFVVDDQRILVFNQTPFYAEWGWEIADTGTITLDNGEQVRIIDVQKSGWVFLHMVA